MGLVPTMTMTMTWMTERTTMMSWTWAVVTQRLTWMRRAQIRITSSWNDDDDADDDDNSSDNDDVWDHHDVSINLDDFEMTPAWTRLSWMTLT